MRFHATWVTDVSAVISAVAAGAAVVIGAFNRRYVLDTHREILETKDKVVQLDVSVDGRLSQLLKTTEQAARALGVQEGIDKNLIAKPGPKENDLI